MGPSTPECTLDDGAGRHIWAGRHVSLRPPPISLVYDTAELIGVDQGSATFIVQRAILAPFPLNKIHVEPQNI